MNKWKIQVRDLTKKKEFIIRGKENQTELEVYRMVKDIATGLRKKYGASVTVDIISCVRAFEPPITLIIPEGRYWCPYCIKPRLFISPDDSSTKKCVVCGISDVDYSVKVANKLFTKEYIEIARETIRGDKK